MGEVKIVECPRDAWQGLPNRIPAEEKAGYLSTLMQCGFRRIDAVSFVSPKLVPQMADSETVMRLLEASDAARLFATEIVGIVVNERGFRRALAMAGVSTVGYPYSISEAFTRANQNLSIAESRTLVEKMQRELAVPTMDMGGEEIGFVVYISMAFGNPYGEAHGPEAVVETVEWLKRIGVRTVSLADTVGKAAPKALGELFRAATSASPEMEIGLHLHSRADTAAEKIEAALDAGCRRFDSALTGLGGCPFAGDELVGNVPTEIVARMAESRGFSTGIESANLERALEATRTLRRKYER